MKRALTFCCVLLSSTALAQYQIVGYYPAWERTVLPPSQLPMSSLTCVIDAFGWPGTDGSLQLESGIPDTSLSSIVHSAQKKILISLGGADNAAGFDSVSVHPERRATFIQNLLTFLSISRYDGIDIDWEEPSTAAQRDSMISLVREIRTAFDNADSAYIITMAIPASDYSGQWYNFTALLPSIDWFNALTYDYHGSWSSFAGHNAPLYAPNDQQDYSVDQSMQYYLATRHIPANKIMLGIPFYGKLFNAVDLLEPFTSEEDLTYSDIVNMVNNRGWVYHWDADADVPYYTNGTSVITFDDSTSVALKCSYAKSKQLAGVMIWELSQDVINRSTPLFDAVSAAMSSMTNVPIVSQHYAPKDFMLFDNFPNPFNPTTVIRYQVPMNGVVVLKVYDALGRQVKTLVNKFESSGSYSVEFDASGLSSGIYFYAIQSGRFFTVKKMVLLK